jgi:uncharacterized protein
MMLFTSVFLVFGAILIAIALVPRYQDPTLPKPTATTETPRPTASQPDGGNTVAPGSGDGKTQADTGKKSRGKLIFIFDDAGHNTWQLEPFLRMPFPISVAVLPGLPYSERAAALVTAAGKELILHQPMEAIENLDPGPGAIRADMDDATIRAVVRENLGRISGAVGMNNHMGSKATSDVRVMTVVLDEVRQAGIYFLDSLTIGDSVVHYVASLMRQTTWERSVFLDNIPDKASILHFIAEGTKVAEKRGYAIMIGHVWSAELAQTLTELYPQLVEQGFSLSTISKVMMDKDEDDGLGD